MREYDGRIVDCLRVRKGKLRLSEQKCITSAGLYPQSPAGSYPLMRRRGVIDRAFEQEACVHFTLYKLTEM